MKLPDVNVMLAAHREDHAHHDIARPWLEALSNATETFVVPDSVWASLVRLATSRRVHPDPSTLDEVFAFIHAVRAQANHVAVPPGRSRLELFERTCREGDAIGDLVPDAQLAALTIELGAELVSFDRDFARFPGLRWTVPGQA